MKKLALLLLCAIPTMTACLQEPTNPTALEAAAKANGFTMQIINENIYQFKKGECVVDFSFMQTTKDASMAFYNVTNDSPNNGNTKTVIVHQQHSMKSGGGQFFYATQIQSTLFMFDGSEDCKDAVKSFADAIKY